MSKPLDLPSLLSFERKLETSDALMFSGNWSDKPIHDDGTTSWQAINIIPRLNRSTQSAQGIDDEKKTKPNPVASSNDDANLPLEHDTLKLSFSLRVIGNLGVPFACNNPAFGKAIVEKVTDFKQNAMLDELAYRYAYNIANGRFLWRNRICAEQIEIQVTINKDANILTFNAYDFSLKDFEKNRENEALQKLSTTLKQGLASDDDFVFIKVSAFVKLGNGQHVFPSQEMNMGEKRKVLFKINDQAAMHNVKVGNALRTVDDWYVDAEFPIAAEPYGAVTQRGEAYRKSKNDLYSLMVEWVNDDEKITDKDKAFVTANLIRGGVFSKGGGD